MKAKLSILALFLIGIAVGCKKDAFTTKPQISLKSISTTKVGPPGDVLKMVLEFTDKEGDIDDSIWISYTTLHCPNSNVVKYYPMPAIPERPYVKGTLEITYSYNGVGGYQIMPSPSCSQNDTGYFKFVLKDRAKNTSDTLTSPQIVVIKS